MDVFGILVEITLGHKRTENAEPSKFGNHFLTLVEGGSESRCGDGAQARSKTVGAFANQELSSTVQGETEEKRLKVDHLSIPRNCIDEVRYMCLESFDVANLATNKVRPEQFATVLPFLSVGCEDAGSNERAESRLSSFWKLPILEFECLYGFEVVGLTGRDKHLMQRWPEKGIGADSLEFA